LGLEKRVLLAIFLIAIVLVFSNLFLVPPAPEDEGSTGQEEVIKDSRGVDEFVAEAEQESVPAPILEAGDSEEDTVFIETDLYSLGVSTRGGRLISMELKEYAASFGEGGVKLLPVRNSSFMGLRVILEKDTLDISGLDFTPSTDMINATSRARNLVLSHMVGSGDSIKIMYTFTPGEYWIDTQLTLPAVLKGREYVVQADLMPRLLPTEVDSAKNDINYFGTIMGREKGGVEGIDIDDLGGDKGEKEYVEGPFVWAGIKNKYFIAALVSKSAPIKGVVSRGAEDERRIGATVLITPDNNGNNIRTTLYIGPQDYYRLSDLGVGLEEIVEYGWWIIRPFTRMIVIVLLWMHQFIENYGVVIILFSVLTKMAFYPLTQKSMKSTQDLQKVQPLLKDLKEKHKDDPQKLQQETMRLYKEHKVNPMGGCLPLLVQMPVLWALFYVFRMTIEFRGAGFALWIQDLSLPDSPPVLPIVMGLSMFIQQKLSPQSADPKMAPMLYIMPVVLTIVFINFPAGLVLYWTINNLLAILQQHLLQKKAAVPVPVKKKTPPEPASK
jgi:YidC/Oxa1 family membrane protein insertase